MPVTMITSAAFQAQAGKVSATSGKIVFPTRFPTPPVLTLTPELRTGGESARVSILSINEEQATFVVEPAAKVEHIHWIAGTVTG